MDEAILNQILKEHAEMERDRQAIDARICDCEHRIKILEGLAGFEDDQKSG